MNADALGSQCQVIFKECQSFRHFFRNIFSFKNKANLLKQIGNAFPGDQKTDVCGASSIECYIAAEKTFYEEDTSNIMYDHDADSFREECNCLPACTSIEYNGEISHIKYDMNVLQKSIGVKKFR